MRVEHVAEVQEFVVEPGVEGVWLVETLGAEGDDALVLVIGVDVEIGAFVGFGAGLAEGQGFEPEREYGELADTVFEAGEEAAFMEPGLVDAEECRVTVVGIKHVIASFAFGVETANEEGRGVRPFAASPACEGRFD
jgi:hypothetical protein